MQTPKEAQQRIVEVWNSYFPEMPEPTKINTFLEKLLILDQAAQSNLRTVIFGYRDLKIYHINVASARYFGATPDEITKVGAPWIFGCFEPEQARVSMNNANFIAENLSHLSPVGITNSCSSYVNWRITCPKGNTHRSLFHSFPVLLDDNGGPLLGMYIINDLEPFMNPETWWCRYKFDGKIQVQHCEDVSIHDSDIISHRELEILKLVYDGASSKDIANELFLSVNTVDNHRRNMLKKSGAVDTSSLIHLCKLCQII
ncbi:MAG TPA: helix-turn-helix transcriptional regulator [Phnomibacter sp.]|nr:helix-turn-helix transcriptional regulator [Phnomibacter sp.]